MSEISDPPVALVQKRILIADEEPAIIMALDLAMRRAGYVVDTARDGVAALSVIHGTPPDLVLLDVTLPIRDGYDVCQAIRSNPDHGQIPIIMLTTKSRDVDRKKALALGATDYLSKPFSTPGLLATIRHYLDHGYPDLGGRT